MKNDSNAPAGEISPAIIDLEASGLASASYPIEVAVWVEGHLHEWLIRPLPHWTHWDSNAERLHGLSRKKLLAEGMEPRTVAAELNKVLGDSSLGIVYSDAPEWDGMWLGRLFDDCGEEQRFQVLSVEDLVAPAPRSQFNQTLASVFANGKYRRHSAGGDVCAIRDALASIVGRSA